jgi:hypothetical protein
VSESGGFGPWSSPALLAFAADAGAFAALSGPDVGMASVGVTPGQVGLQPAGQHGVVRVVRAADDEGAQRSELRLGLAQEAFVGVKHSFTLCLFAQPRMGGVSFADRLSKIT